MVEMNVVKEVEADFKLVELYMAKDWGGSLEMSCLTITAKNWCENFIAI